MYLSAAVSRESIVTQLGLLVQVVKEGAGVLVKAEERAKGRVDRRLYKTYLSAWGPFFAIPVLMVGMAMTERGLQVGVRCTLHLCTPGNPCVHCICEHLATFVYSCEHLATLVYTCEHLATLVYTCEHL